MSTRAKIGSAASRRETALYFMRHRAAERDPKRRCQLWLAGCLGTTRTELGRQVCYADYVECLRAEGIALGQAPGPFRCLGAYHPAAALRRLDPARLPARKRYGLALILGAGALTLTIWALRRYTSRSMAPRLVPQYARYQQLVDLSYRAASAAGVGQYTNWMVAIGLKENGGRVNFQGHNGGGPDGARGGAWGQWQFLPATARTFGWRGSMESFLNDPEGQARVMATALAFYVRHARETCGRVDYDLIIAKHNGGARRCTMANMTRDRYRPGALRYLAQVDQMLAGAEESDASSGGATQVSLTVDLSTLDDGTFAGKVFPYEDVEGVVV